MKANFLTYLPIILLESLGRILYFPLWWYGTGLIKRLKSLYFFIKDKEKSLGFSVWLKNIFVPMYGQTDFSGRMISFFVRLFQVFIRGVALLFWFFVSFLLLVFWIVLPMALIFALVFQIF